MVFPELQGKPPQGRGADVPKVAGHLDGCESDGQMKKIKLVGMRYKTARDSGTGSVGVR